MAELHQVGWLFGLIAARLVPLAILLPSTFAAGFRRVWTIALTVVMALLVTPLYSLPAHLPWTPWALAAVLLRELLLGIALGFGCVSLLAALQMAGRWIAQIAGLNLPDQWDAGNAVHGQSGLERYFTLVAFAILMVSGGHRELVQALLDSFDAVPPGASLGSVDVSASMADVLLHSFSLGIRLAAPISFCLLVTSFLLAILSRATPFMGALGTNVALNLVVFLLVSCVSLETLATVYQQGWSSSVAALSGLLPVMESLP